MCGGALKYSHVIVVGGGIAGLLAAAAVAPYAERVSVLERDRLSGGTGPRAGVPQGRHLHTLLSSGARAIDQLLPGTLSHLYQHGARHLSFPGDVLMYGSWGWLRGEPRQYILGATRPLIEESVRAMLLKHYSSVSLLERCRVTRLIVDSSRVRGVLFFNAEKKEEEMAGDLVVVSSGRSADALSWLQHTGFKGTVRKELIDAGLGYASRAVRPHPDDAEKYACVSVQAEPGAGVPGRAGFIIGTENGDWMVTLSGTKGATPPVSDEGFLEFASGLRHPLIHQLLERATPTGKIFGYRHTQNARYRLDSVRNLPSGVLFIGDTVAQFNPAYAHGMSVAALAALEVVQGLGRDKELHALQRAVCRAGHTAWALSTSADARYPGAVASRVISKPFLNKMADRLQATAATSPRVGDAFADVLTLSEPLHVLARPAVISRILKGPTAPPSHVPPRSRP
ncbi:FAD-dependent oxidoreductase [Streptomyces sp. NPDC002952]|uniref:FAD-dependent oxidoreductase n=1 Tax=Streptomyces sp. NPDC002952 TaxID=3364673 RepID=UPI00368BD567